MNEEQFKKLTKRLNSKISNVSNILTDEIQYSPDNKYLTTLSKKIASTKEKCEKQSFKIAVLALIKAGKSTFINAILGNDFLPSNTFPETSRIVRIVHSSETKLVDSSKDLVIVGLSEIQNYIKQLNIDARENNQQPTEDELILHAPIFKLKDEKLNGVSFEILDTPGPDEAGADKLRERVNNMLSSIDVIVYMLDYTRLNAQAEKELLEKLRNLREDLLENIKNRLFFVVNKIDAKSELSPDKNETIEFVHKNIQPIIPTLTRDKILVASSEYALLSRMLMSDNYDRKKDFAKIAYGELMAEHKSNEDCKNDSPNILKKSNIPEIEDKVISHIYQNRSVILIETLISDTFKVVKELIKYFTTTRGALSKDIDSIASDLEQIRKEVNEAKKNLEDVNQLASSFKLEIKDWIQNNFNDFKESVEIIINKSFDNPNSLDTSHNSDNHGIVIDIASIAGKFVTEVVGIFNPRVGEFLRKIFKRSEGAVLNLKDLISKIKILKSSKNEADLRTTVIALNNSIVSFMSSAFVEFRDELEYDAIKKQKDLFSQFEDVVNHSRKQIETKIGKQLNIELEETPISFPVDDMNSFHNDINEFIKRHEKRTTETIKNGWCRKDEYRTVTDVIFTVDKSDIKKHWLKEIDTMHRSSLITAEKLVDKHINKQIENAKNTFIEYADNYISIISREYQEKQKGNKQYKARIDNIEKILDEIKEISKDLIDIKSGV